MNRSMNYYLLVYQRENHRSNRVLPLMNSNVNSVDVFDVDMRDQLIFLHMFHRVTKNYLYHIRFLFELIE